MADRPDPERWPTSPRCGCREVCGDLPEDWDDPRAVCRGLPMPPREPLVELVVERRDG